MKNSLFIGIVGCAMLATIPLAGCEHEDRDKTEKKEVEETVTLADCPAPVQATIAKAVGAGTIQKLVKENENGKMIYSVDATVDSKKVEINVAMDGTLISNKPDEEKPK